MLKSHVKFHSTSGKRQILIVDDELVNREMLSFMASTDFDSFLAADGEEALKILRDEAEHISLVLLDLMMPGIDGYEVLKIMRKDTRYARIPVIVLTSEEKAEVECLHLGASDFIIKPFHSPEVILARMQRTIELSEDRTIISSTEREPLTGLFVKNYFYRYAEQFDQYHTDLQMDAVALDISHFHLINEMYGRDAGDEVLKRMGSFIREQVLSKTDGMAARLDADKFLLYLPHDMVRYEDMLVQLNEHFNLFSDVNVRVRSGVYLNVDKMIDIERRFDRASQAASRIKNDFSKAISFYDNTIYEREMYAERLLSEMDTALAEKQFEVWYQPKYNVAGFEPVLSSAEALVRWRHPELGMISPGLFIPLFEKNGLIQKLDYYIWAKVGEDIRHWKETGKGALPVSVNVSRMDLYHHDLASYLQKILEDNGLSSNAIYLEITESAYTENPEQIVMMIDLLRNKGFLIEMDDFGTGYSSLSMLADIPVDIVKLDMKFVQNLRTNEKQETLVRLIMDIAKYLNVRVVAEGVEEEGQVDFLRKVGCMIIQGYDFSKPLPEPELAELLSREGRNR